MPLIQNTFIQHWSYHRQHRVAVFSCCAFRNRGVFALGTLRPFRINEWITLLFGIITPFYFLAGWLFLNDKFDLVVNPVKNVYAAKV